MKKKLICIPILLFLGVFFSQVCLNAQTYYWLKGSGDWAVPNNWKDGYGGTTYGFAPGAVHDIVIDLDSLNGGTITMPLNPVDIKSFTTVGSSLQPCTLKFAGGTALTINGNLDISDEMVFNTATGNATIKLQGNGNHIIRSSGTVFNAIHFYLENDGPGVYTFVDNFRNSSSSSGNSLDIRTGNWFASGISIQTTRFVTSGTGRNVSFTNCQVRADAFSVASSFNSFNNTGTSWVVTGGVTSNGGGLFANSGNTPINYNTIQFTQSTGELRNNSTSLTGMSVNHLIIAKNFQISAYQNNGDLSINQITVQSGGTITIGGSANIPGPKTISVINGINVPGNCSNTVNFLGLNQQINWNLNNPLSLNYCTFFNINPNNFIVDGNNTCVDMGQNDLTGFTNLNYLPKKYFWCGSASADWNNGLNWSVDPMSCIPANCIPTIIDTVIVDNIHLGFGGSSTMQLNLSGYCASLLFNNTTPFIFSGSGNLYVSQNIKLAPQASLTNNFGGQLYLMNESSSAFGPTLLTSQGNVFRCGINTIGTGAYHLTDPFISQNTPANSLRVFFHKTGAFRTLGHSLTAVKIDILQSNVPRVFDITNSTVTLTNSTPGSGEAMSLHADFLDFVSVGSVINIIGKDKGLKVERNQAAIAFNMVNFTNTQGEAYVENFNTNSLGVNHPVRFRRLNFSASAKIFTGASQVVNLIDTDTLILSSGREYTISAAKNIIVRKHLQALNTCVSGYISIKGLGGVANINTAPGFNYQQYSFMKIDNVTVNVNGSSGSFDALNSLFFNNTNGWNGLPTPSITYYWIGEGSNPNWDTPDNWSLTPPTQGDDASPGCIPGPDDDVVFLNDDAFYHNALVAQKRVFVNVNATCRNMTWGNFTPALKPTFSSDFNAPNLQINGSLHYASSAEMNMHFTGNTYFNSSKSNETIRTNGNTIRNSFYFTGQAVYSLLDNLIMSVTTSSTPPYSQVSDIIVESGGLNTQGHDIYTFRFLALTSFPRNINIKNSFISLTSSQSIGWNLETQGLTFNADSSEIYFTTLTGLGPQHITTGPNPVSYNSVKFEGPGRISVNLSGVSFNRVFFGGNSELNNGGQGSSYPPVTLNIDTLIYSAGTDNVIHDGGFVMSNKLIADGINCNQITIRSQTPGVFTNLCAVGVDSFSVKNVNLYDINSSCNAMLSPNAAFANSSLYNTINWNNTGVDLSGFSFPDNLPLTCADFPYNLSTAPYNPGPLAAFNWNGMGLGGNTDFLVNQPGFYVVDIQFTPTCILRDSTFITVVNNLAASANVYDALCYDSNDGAVAINLSNNSPIHNYNYIWTPAQPNADSLSGLSPGNYVVNIADQFNNCSTSVNITIDEPDSLRIQQNTITPVSCFGLADGEIDVNVAGGTVNYQYLWDDPSAQTTDNPSGLAAGTYTLTVTDRNNCVKSFDFTVTEPDVLEATTNAVNDVLCYGQSNGNAEINVDGGNTGFNYTLFDAPAFSVGSPASSTVSNLSVGNYAVVVVDNKGCRDTVLFAVAQPDSLLLSNLVDSVSCNGLADGEAAVNVAGGTPGYNFLWSNGQTQANAVSLAAGTYSVTVTDNNGCSKITSIEVREPDPISISNSLTTHVTCHGGGDGVLQVSASGGNGSTYDYDWTPGNPSGDGTSYVSGLTAGSYSVLVTDVKGCTNTLNMTVNQPAAFVYTPQFNQPACNGAPTGSIQVAIAGGTSGYNYSWNGVPAGSGSTAVLNNVPSGTYVLQITDGNNCPDSVSYILNEPSEIEFSTPPVVSNVSCPGGNNGSIAVSASGGSGSLSYQWNTGAQTAVLNNLPAGTYNITVTDQNNCQYLETFVVTQPDTFQYSQPVVSNPACFGQANGSINLPLGISGGTAPYVNYTWFPAPPVGQGTLSISGLAAGTYTLNVLDNNGCPSSKTYTLVNPPALVVNSTSSVPPLCNAGADGSAQVTSVTGGVQTSGYTYNWLVNPNPIGQGTSQITGIAAGTYTVEVSDDNGCITTTAVQVNQPAPFSFTPQFTPPACNGVANGSIAVTVAGGTSGYNFSWNGVPSGSGTTNTLSNVPSGTYLLEITDANNCPGSVSYILNEPAEIDFSSPPSVTNVSCPGGNNGAISVNASGGSGSLTYLWDTGSQSASLSNLQAGTYTLTITDQQNCEYMETFVVTQPDTFQYSQPVITNPLCFGQSNGTINLPLGISGGTAPYASYTWSPAPPSGQGSLSISGLGAGTYTLNILDNNGCPSSRSYTIVNPPALVINSTSFAAPLCFNGTDGSAEVSSVSGGVQTSGYNYNWLINPAPNGQGTSQITGLSAGTYTVQVTDDNLCLTSATITVTQPSAIQINQAIQHVACHGDSTAQITVAPSGGTGTYTYNWNGAATPNGEGTATVNGLPAGSHSVVVTDANLCATNFDFTVNQPTPLETDSVIQFNVTCNGGVNGSAMVMVSGGNSSVPYTYQWDNGSQTNSIAGVQAGNYSLVVSDANNCTLTQNVTISQPLPFTVQLQPVSDTLVTCHGSTDGVLSVVANGSNGGQYGYVWSGGLTGSLISSLGAGIYTLTVSDSVGCTSDFTYNVHEPAEYVISASVSPVDCAVGALSGSATISVSGNTPGYNYQWTPSVSTSSSSNTLGAGVYHVTITDALGCQDSVSFIIGSINGPQLSSISTPVLCNGGETGTATVVVSGGAGNPNFVWFDSLANPILPAQNAATAVGLGAGTYYVEVNSLGCIVFDTVSVSEPALLLANLSDSVNVSCYGGSNGSLTVAASGGVSPYQYAWSNGATAAALNNLLSGTYTLVITDSNNCQVTSTYVVSQPDSITISLNQLDLVLCNGGNTASVISSVSGGLSPYTYLWNNGTSNDSVDSLSAGTYTLLVTDSNGCQMQQTITIDEPLELEALILNILPPNCTKGNGVLTADAAGGTGNYSFNWQGTLTGNTSVLTGIAGDDSGQYMLTVTDENGCLDSLLVQFDCTKDSLYIPQFISPDNDGKNDFWELVGIEEYPNNEVEIFNRFGNPVFKASKYDNNTPFNGEANVKGTVGKGLLPAGTYFYKIDLNGNGKDVLTGYMEVHH